MPDTIYNRRLVEAHWFCGQASAHILRAATSTERGNHEQLLANACRALMRAMVDLLPVLTSPFARGLAGELAALTKDAERAGQINRQATPSLDDIDADLSITPIDVSAAPEGPPVH